MTLIEAQQAGIAPWDNLIEEKFSTRVYFDKYPCAAGQTVMYPHVHLIPRHKGDVADPVGGVRNTIPGKGNYRKCVS